MATQAYPYMVISDGTTTVTIQDGSGGATNYPLVRDGWAPAVAGLRASPLTGYTPYEDVVETFTIEINGATATAALANLATLTKLLDQAARWYRGENVTAVLLKIAPHGSTVSATATPLQAAILGGSVKAPPRWDEVGRNFVIPNVEVSVIRRGLWLHPTTEASTPSAVDNGSLVTFTLTARDIKSPTKLQFTNFGIGGGGSSYFPGGFVIVGEPVGGSASIVISNAEGGTAATYTAVAPGMNAKNATVLRYTPTDTTERTSGAIDPSMPSTTRLVAIFINVRPSATVTFTVRARVDSLAQYRHTPYVVVAPDTNQTPKWIFLGVVAISGAIVHTYLKCTANSAASNLDIDTVVYCDTEACQTVAFESSDDPLSGFSYFAPVTGTAVIDHRLLTYPTPSFVDNSTPMIAKGDLAITTQAAAVYALLLATGGGTASYGQEYRQADTGTDALLQNTWTATRSTAYLVPQ